MILPATAGITCLYGARRIKVVSSLLRNASALRHARNRNMCEQGSYLGLLPWALVLGGPLRTYLSAAQRGPHMPMAEKALIPLSLLLGLSLRCIAVSGLLSTRSSYS